MSRSESHNCDAQAQVQAKRPELDLFDLIALAWSQRIFIVLVSLVIFLPLSIAAYLSLTPTYTAGSRLLVIMDEDDLTPGAAGSGGEFMFDQIMQSEAELLGSEEIRRRMLAERTGQLDPDQLKMLREGFGVNRAPNASFLVATFKDKDPVLAANTVNAIVDSYLRYRVELLVGGFEGGVAARLEAAEDDALEAQQTLRAFLIEHNIVDFATERDSALGRMADLQTRMLQAQAEAAQARALARALSERLADLPETVELSVENSVTGQLLDLQVRRTELLARYQPDAPPVLAVEREIEAMERFVNEGRAEGQGQRRTGINPIWQELESARLQQESSAAGQARLAASLQTQLEAARAELSRLRELAPEFDRLTRAVTARAQAAEQLSVQAADALARSNQPSGGADAIRVVSRATPPALPESRRKLAVMAIAVVAGGIGGLAGLIRGYLLAVTEPEVYEPAPTPPQPETGSGRPVPAAPQNEPGPSRASPRHDQGLPVLARVSEHTDL